MKKKLGIIAGSLTALLWALPAFAENIPIAPPAGSIANVAVAKLPQFLINLIFVVGIIIAVIFLIYGGIKWILSGGDKQAVEAARNHIIAAIVGLIIVVGAFFIISLVFTLLGQANPLSGGFHLPTLDNPNGP